DIQDPAQLPDPKLVYEAVASDRSVRMMDHTFAGVREGSGVWMKAEEKALLERLDGKRTGEELARDLGLDEHKLRYALYHLQQEGLARVVEGPAPRRAPQAPAPAAPVVSAPKAQPAPPAPRPAPAAPAAPRPAPRPGGGVLRTDTDHGAGSGPRRLDGSKSGVTPPRPSARAEEGEEVGSP